MLEEDYPEQLSSLLPTLPNKIVLPEPLSDILSRRGAAPSCVDERRRFARFYFGAKAVLEISPTLPAIPREEGRHAIYTANLSRSGVGFLHFEELYPGETVKLWLSQAKISCVVMHCSRKGPDCYFVGASLGPDVPKDYFQCLNFESPAAC